MSGRASKALAEASLPGEPRTYFVRWVIKVNWWRHVQGVRHNAALRISLNILCAMLNAAVPIQN
jgi:hypothetical protein